MFSRADLVGSNEINNMQSFYDGIARVSRHVTWLSHCLQTNSEETNFKVTRISPRRVELPENRSRGTEVATQTQTERTSWANEDIEEDDEDAGRSNAGDTVHSSSAPEDGELEDDRIERRNRRKAPLQLAQGSRTDLEVPGGIANQMWEIWEYFVAAGENEGHLAALKNRDAAPML